MRLANQADSLYKVKNYASAAAHYRKAALVPVEKGIEMPVAELQYAIAGNWALPTNPTALFII